MRESNWIAFCATQFAISMAAIISFFVSAFLIMGLIALRYIEMGQGKRYAENVRFRLDTLVEHIIYYIVHTLPNTLVRVSHIIVLSLVHKFSLVLLNIVRILERRLYGFVNVAKGRKRSVERNEKPSPFLQSMREHKQQVNGNRVIRHEEK